MGKIMYMNKEFQGRIPRVSGEIIYEEDYDYEWDFTRNDHPELDINHGEPIWVYNNSKVSYSNSGMVIGATGVSVPLGNMDTVYWDKICSKCGKTVEIDIVEITGTNKPSIPSGSGRNYKRMFVTNAYASIARIPIENYAYRVGKNNYGSYDADQGLLYAQRSTPELSGWTPYIGRWEDTTTPETTAYDSIGYFDGKTLKFEFTNILYNSAYEFRIYLDNTLFYTGTFPKTTANMYLPVFVIQDYDGMGGMTISGVRVYKNEWYEPKFQPES